MILSAAMKELLEERLRNNPLQKGEIRRVEGMGELYLSGDENESSEYEFLYSLKLSGRSYNFYSR